MQFVQEINLEIMRNTQEKDEKCAQNIKHSKK